MRMNKKMRISLPKGTPCLTHSLPRGAAGARSLCTWELGAAALSKRRPRQYSVSQSLPAVELKLVFARLVASAP